jgi:hypothetical protein
LEYDNQYNQDQFTAQVLKFLGSSYSVTSKTEKTAKQDNLYKLEASSSDPKYYVYVNTNNYYVLVFRNANSSASEVTKFMNNALSWLYLN